MKTVEVTHTAMADRREQATDSRGLPSSFARAIEALKGECAHCGQRAIVASGSGIGLCERHKRECETQRTDAERQTGRLRRQIGIEKKRIV
jgi:hypothetical protein